jgi:hypothetical protein
MGFCQGGKPGAKGPRFQIGLLAVGYGSTW